MRKLFIIIMILALTFVMAACGGSSDAAYDEGGDAKSTNSYDGFGGNVADEDMRAEEPAAEYGGDMAPSENAQAASDGQAELGLPSSVNKDKVKLIYTADMNIQTLDFDEAVKGLTKLTEQFGGYFESISTDNGGYFDSDAYKYGSFTVRVPSDKYQKFLNSLSEGMHVVFLNQRAEDIGQMYFETERRVETLKNKHDRLEELLKKADKMKDIIELESALSDVEFELEQYTSELNRYDSLVSFSTVYVNIEKVANYSTGIEEELGFGQRLLRSLVNGASEFGAGLEDLINWIGYHIIQLVILAAVIIAVIKGRVFEKIREGSDARSAARAEKKRMKAERKAIKAGAESKDQGDNK